MTVLHIDFETRSTVDLKAAGLDNYAKHPTTDVWCMAYAFDDEDVRVLNTTQMGNNLQPFKRIGEYVEAGGTVIAHNAAFELAIWNQIMVPRYGWPPLKVEQTRCTMSMAYAMALPGSLEKAAAAVGIHEQKDTGGYRLMMQMCRPRETKPDGTLTWWDEPEKLAKLYEYCKQDVRVERELDKRLMQLSPAEQRLWVLDQKINQRGVYVDTQAAGKAMGVVRAEADRLNLAMRDVTGNFVGFCTETARIKKWIATRGVDLPGIAKADVLDALMDGTLPDDVRDALRLRQEAGKSSTAKLSPMLEAAGADGRLRGMFQYHGAGTGRWAGRKVQLHNFPRWPEGFHLKDAEHVLDVLMTKDAQHAADYIRLFYDNPLSIVSYLLRPLLRAAPGNELFVCDFANIEGRVLAWLAGEDWKLDAFRAYDEGRGPDLYLVAASRIYRVPVDECKPYRQTGKVSELSLGFQGGLGAFRQMEKGLGLKLGLDDEQVQTAKGGWRDGHPKIVDYWDAIDRAAMNAVFTKGQKFSVGSAGRQCHFKQSGSFLWCQLPSGRVLCYPYPKILPVETPWGESRDALTYMTVVSQDQKGKAKIIPDPQGKGDWQRVSTYGGKLAENVTQATARDALSSAIERCEAAGYPTVLHVHDENVAEVKKDTRDFEEFKRLCAVVPDFLKGLPIAVSGWRGERYRK